MDSTEFLKTIGTARDKVKTESDSPIHKIMQQFARDKVDEMKANTPKASGALAASIDFDFGAAGGILTIDFIADDYWDYVNSGVDGVRGSAGAIPNKFGQTYSFKTEVPSRKMVDAFIGTSKQNWLASKGIKSLVWTDKESGKKITKQLTTDEDYRAAAFVFSRAVKRKGIQPSNFVGKAITEDSIKQLEELLIDALANLI